MCLKLLKLNCMFSEDHLHICHREDNQHGQPVRQIKQLVVQSTWWLHQTTISSEEFVSKII